MAKKFIHIRFVTFLGAVLLGLLLISSTAQAGLQSQMDDMFDTMSNVTSPKAVMGQRRGLLTGGRISVRTKAMNIQPFSVLPPSYDAGCGGIDLFGGSFSFISSEQLQQALRAIAANAVPYAFEIALQAMCPTCDDIMSKLKALAQKLTSMASNSCEVAQQTVKTMVNLTPQGVKDATQSAMAPVAVATGAVDDFLSGMFDSTKDKKKNTAAQVNKTSDGRKEAHKKQITGNIVWMALKGKNKSGQTVTEQWWDDGSGFKEIVMSVSGSVVVHPSKDEDHDPEITWLSPTVDVADFLDGVADSGKDEDDENPTTIRVYKCNDDKCMDPSVVDKPVVNFTEMVRHRVNQIVYHYSNNTAFSNKDKAFMIAAPNPIGGMLRNLSRLSPGLAAVYANAASPKIAQIMATQLVLDLLKTAQMAIENSQSPSAAQVREDIARTRDEALQRTQTLQKNMSSRGQMFASYGNMMNASQKTNLGLGQLAHQTSGRK